MKLKFTLLGMLSCISISSQISLLKDTSFGTGGIAKISCPEALSDSNFEKIFMNPDGSLMVSVGSEGTVHSGMIAKLTTSGALDQNFGNSGKIMLRAAAGTGIQYAQQGQKIIAVYANDNDAPTSSAMLKRFTSDGTVDITFGTNGTMMARPDLFYNQLNFKHNGFYHLWGKITAYFPDGTINNSYGSSGSQNPVVNGIQQEYMELYSYFGKSSGKNFLHKYHYEIAVSSEDTPHQFTTYNLMNTTLYDVPGAANGVSVYSKKFLITPQNEILYLYGISTNNGEEQTRATLLSVTAQPKNFNGKTFIDLGQLTINNQITDAISLQNHYLFAGNKNGKPALSAYDFYGTRSTINGAQDFYENLGADRFVTMMADGNNLFLLVKNSASNELYIIKYKTNLLKTKDSLSGEVRINTPFSESLNVFTSHKIKKISIFDSSGKIVKTGSGPQISTQNLARGLYIVLIDFYDRPSQQFKSLKK